jgi:DNA-binding transcriptional MerR regulator
MASAASKSDDWTIRAMREAFGVTARTLRFYEAEDLLHPRRDGAMRLYSARDRARLKLILQGKRFGFSLAEIRELLSLYDLGDGQVTQLARTRARAVERLAAMQTQRAELDDAIADLRAQIAMVDRLLTEKSASVDARAAHPQPERQT